MSDSENLKRIAKSIDDQLPDGQGFCCFVFPFEDMVDEPRVQYISNGQREDVIVAIKQWLFNQGEHENWMEHIE